VKLDLQSFVKTNQILGKSVIGDMMPATYLNEIS
jgi:hypothetical protein